MEFPLNTAQSDFWYSFIKLSNVPQNGHSTKDRTEHFPGIYYIQFSHQPC